MQITNFPLIANTQDSDEGIPAGWENVRLTDAEIDALCAAAGAGDVEAAEKIVDGAYARLFGASLN